MNILKTDWKRLAAYGLLVLILLLAFFLRKNVSNTLHYKVTGTIYMCMILHQLPLLNFSDYFLDNYFASMFVEYHGPYDHYYFYAYTKLLDIVNLPINMYTIGMGNVVLSLATIFLIYIVGRIYFNGVVGLIAALLLALSISDINQALFIARTSGSITATICIFLISLKYFMEKKNTLWTVIVAVVIVIASTGELIFQIPLLYVTGVAFMLAYETPGRVTIRDIGRFLLQRRSVMFLLLSVPMAIAHYLIYLRGFGLFIAVSGYKKYHFLDREFFTFMLSFLSGGGSVLFAVLVWLMFIYLIVRGESKTRWLIAMYATIALVLAIELSVGDRPSVHSMHLFYTIIPFCVFSAATIFYFIKHIGSKQKGYLYQYVAAVVLIAAFSPQIVEVIEDYGKRPAYKPSALAPVGWYIRKYGEKYTSKVYNLFDDVDDSAQGIWKKAHYHYNTPFWYGKQISVDFFQKGSLHPLEHYRRAIYGYSDIFFTHLPDRYDINAYPFKFDFIVVIPDFLVKEAVRKFAERNLEALQKDGYRVVAVVKDEGRVAAKIYSYKELPYVEMELYTYSKKWDDDYGNLSNLFEHNRIGIPMEMGKIERLDKSYKEHFRNRQRPSIR